MSLQLSSARQITLSVLGRWNAHRELHILPDEKFEISRVIVEGFNMV